MSTAPQVVEPLVTRTKFEREVQRYEQQADDYRRRGWFLIDATYPLAFVVMAAPQLKPSPIVTGVQLDFTDYDVRPPSVRLVDPFTREPYVAGDLPTNLLRQVEAAAVPIGVFPPGMVPPRMVQQQPLMQSYGPDQIPFLCIPGVREYHEHPAHSGDRWELHRRGGAGGLIRILEIIDTYGVRPLNGFGVRLETHVSGLTQTEVPA